MVFKARGCRTCVQRRVKCDSTKPICEKCTKANRSCIWDPNEQAGLRFQDESAFAQGRARRPRNSKGKSLNTTVVAIVKQPPAAPQTALSISLDEQAFQYWVQTNVSHAEYLHEAAHEWHTYVLPYWMKAKPGSCLHLAVSTLSRAVFGRARNVPQALVQAGKSYAQCLARTQQAVSGQLHESMDELLLTTMLMGYFENIRYSVAGVETPVKKIDAVGSRFTNVFCHYEGAMGLVDIRREGSEVTDITLDKVARRQIVSVLINPKDSSTRLTTEDSRVHSARKYHPWLVARWSLVWGIRPVTTDRFFHGPNSCLQIESSQLLLQCIRCFAHQHTRLRVPRPHRQRARRRSCAMGGVNVRRMASSPTKSSRTD